MTSKVVKFYRLACLFVGGEGREGFMSGGREGGFWIYRSSG